MGKVYLGNQELAFASFKKEERYGVGINAFLGDTDSDGNILAPTDFSVELNANGIGDNGLAYRFQYSGIAEAVYNIKVINGDKAMFNCHSFAASLTSVYYPNLTSIAGTSAMENNHNNCSALTNISYPSLTSINGAAAMKGCHNNCKALTMASYPELLSINGVNAMNSCHAYNSALVTVQFPKLTTIIGATAMLSCFSRCTSLRSIYFPALVEIGPDGTNNQLNNMFQYDTGMQAIHFRADMQSRIEQLTGYSSKFGATNATIYFDL